MRMQALVEGLLSEYPNILILRVRMPIVGDLTYPRNFITKIIKYDKVRLRRACPPRLRMPARRRTPHLLAQLTGLVISEALPQCYRWH